MKSFMEEAIKEAKKAEELNEVPIGAVVVYNGKIISRGHNQREKSQNALHHAELIAINKACKKMKSWRLEECTIYVTLEPCPMCAGAIVNSRIKKVIYAAKELSSKDGLLEKILKSDRLNHKCELEQDTKYEKECSMILTNFFKNKRNNKNMV